MKKLTEFIVEKITGSDDFSVNEEVVDGHAELEIVAPKGVVGLIIGREGKTIRSIRNIVKVRAVLEKASFNLTVTEK